MTETIPLYNDIVLKKFVRSNIEGNTELPSAIHPHVVPTYLYEAYRQGSPNDTIHILLMGWFTYTVEPIFSKGDEKEDRKLQLEKFQKIRENHKFFNVLCHSNGTLLYPILNSETYVVLENVELKEDMFPIEHGDLVLPSNVIMDAPVDILVYEIKPSGNMIRESTKFDQVLKDFLKRLKNLGVKEEVQVGSLYNHIMKYAVQFKDSEESEKKKFAEDVRSKFATHSKSEVFFLHTHENTLKKIQLDNHSLFSLWYLDYVLAKNYGLELVDQDVNKIMFMRTKIPIQYTLNHWAYYREEHGFVSLKSEKKFTSTIPPEFRRIDETKEASAYNSIMDGNVSAFRDDSVNYLFGSQTWQTFRLPPYEFDVMDERSTINWKTISFRDEMMEEEKVKESSKKEPKKYEEDRMETIDTRYKTTPLTSSNTKLQPTQIKSMQQDSKIKNYSISPKYKFPFTLKIITNRLAMDGMQLELMNTNKVNFGILENKWRRLVPSAIKDAPVIKFPSHRNTLVYMAWYYGVYDMAIDTFPFTCYDLFTNEHSHKQKGTRNESAKLLVNDTFPSK